MHTVVHAGSPSSPRSSSATTRVAIAGATGYVGQELLRLLARHPAVTVTAAMSSGAARGEPGLLSDCGAAGAPATDRRGTAPSRSRRGYRREVRDIRRGEITIGAHPFFGVPRQRGGLRPVQPSSWRRDRAGGPPR